jgi:hypothetical protein
VPDPRLLRNSGGLVGAPGRRVVGPKCKQTSLSPYLLILPTLSSPTSPWVSAALGWTCMILAIERCCWSCCATPTSWFTVICPMHWNRLELGAKRRRQIRPGLVDIALDTYGRSGPWRTRRGFDSLVQMSTGIAEEGMRTLGKDQPAPLPVQAIDHATGYLLAAATLRGLTERARTSRGFGARASLARTAQSLIGGSRRDGSADLGVPAEDGWSEDLEPTAFGMARRLKSPVTIDDEQLRWDRPSARLASSPPVG